MADPHEIGNVLGPWGMVALIEEANELPLKVMLRVPTQIPGTPGLETTGATIDDQDFLALTSASRLSSGGGGLQPHLVARPEQISSRSHW